MGLSPVWITIVRMSCSTNNTADRFNSKMNVYSKTSLDAMIFHYANMPTKYRFSSCKNANFRLKILIFPLSFMWRSHQPRFHPDLNRGLYRERVGVVLSAPIRSYHVLMSILTIGLIVENFLAAKKFNLIILQRLPRLSGPSHQIV